MEGEKSEYLTHLHVANADGQRPVLLTQGHKSCENPQWAPDGKALAFTPPAPASQRLADPRPRHGGQRLTDVKTGVNSFKWSPDGTQLAYTAPDGPTPEEEKATRRRPMPTWSMNS